MLKKNEARFFAMLAAAGLLGWASSPAAAVVRIEMFIKEIRRAVQAAPDACREHG